MRIHNLLIIILTILSVSVACASPKKAIASPTPNQEVVVLKTQLQIQIDLCDAIAKKAEDIEAANDNIQKENTILKNNADSLTQTLTSQTSTIDNLEKDAIELQKAKDTAEANLKAEKAKQLQTGRERDVFILLFSVLSTIYFAPMLIKFLGTINTFAPVMTGYTWLPMIVAPVIIFSASFWGIRLLIQMLVHLIFK